MIMLGEFVGQTVYSSLVRYRALTCSYDDEHIVGWGVFCNIDESYPLWHFGIFGSHVWVPTFDIHLDE